jgi:Rieske Fe-S protein
MEMDEQSIRGAPRRVFLKWVAGIAGGATALIAAVPVLGAVLFPVRSRTVTEGEGFIPLGDFAELTLGSPVKAAVRTTRVDAWSKTKGVELATVWLEKRPDGSVLALSSICPHLGCSVDYLPESKTYNCPCHDSVFGRDGSKVSGPSPRRLDALETRVQEGRVLVKFERFVCGTPDQRKA